MPKQTYMWLAGTTRYPCGCIGEGGKDGHTLTPCPLHARAAEMRELLAGFLRNGCPSIDICQNPLHDKARALLEETK